MQRGNVKIDNRRLLNALLYIAENGCKWRALAEALWQLAYDLYPHECWAKAGVLDRLFEELQREQLIRIKIEAVSLDSTIVKVHPDGTGALKKTAPKPSANPEADGQPKFIWLPRSARCAIGFSLSPGQAGDAPEGRELYATRSKASSAAFRSAAAC